MYEKEERTSLSHAYFASPLAPCYIKVPLYKGDYIKLLIETIGRSMRRAKYIKFY